MTWTNFLVYLRLKIPEAASTVITDANMLIITNLICTEFADLTECLQTYTQFDTVAEQQIYKISTEIPTFLRIRKEGAYWYDTDNSRWIYLRSRTFAQLSERERTWINRDSGIPLYFWIEGDEMGLHPKPDTTTTGDSGVRVYHFAQSTDMTAGGHYPISGSTTKYPHISQYDEVLVEGVKYRVKDILGKKQEAGQVQQIFYAKCEKIKGELRERPDLIKDNVPRGMSYPDFS
jgi:hypothetical protein